MALFSRRKIDGDFFEGIAKLNEADYLDFQWEEFLETRIHYIGKELDSVRQKIVKGGNVRALANGRWGFVSFNKLDQLNESMKLATRIARLIGKGKSILADAQVVQDNLAVDCKERPSDVSLEEKNELCKKGSELLVGFPKIRSSQIVYSDKYGQKYYINSEGSVIEREKSNVNLRVIAVAKEKGNIQTAWESLSGEGYEMTRSLDGKIKRAAERAVGLLDARSAVGGVFTVIADAGACGFLVHEVLGHLSEADRIYENKTLQKEMRIGRKLSNEKLNVIDNGTILGQLGCSKYDDEGVLCSKTYLIKDGILSGRLHSRETAGRMDEKPTGNARSVDYNYAPIVRMTCTYIEPGDWTFEEMIEDIKQGYYIKGVEAGQTSLTAFICSGREVFFIRNGELGEEIKNFSFSGNIYPVLENIDAVGKDLALFSGNCDKGLQRDLPVSFGGPHIRLQNALIGGKER